MKDLSALLVLVCLLLAYRNSKAHFLNVNMSHLLNICSVNTFRFKSLKIYFSACVFVYVPCVYGICVSCKGIAGVEGSCETSDVCAGTQLNSGTVQECKGA